MTAPLPYSLMPPGRGRRPAPIAYALQRALDETDIVSMWEASKAGRITVKTLRHHHHLLAKAIASGRSMMECASLTGLTLARISVLKEDPAFQELIYYYSERLDEVFFDTHARMAALSKGLLEEITERFEADPEKFSKRELLDLFTAMADRSIPTAKGGPSPQAALPGSGGAAPVALQINFVSPAPDAGLVIEQVAAQGHPREGREFVPPAAMRITDALPVVIEQREAQDRQDALRTAAEILDEME